MENNELENPEVALILDYKVLYEQTKKDLRGLRKFAKNTDKQNKLFVQFIHSISPLFYQVDSNEFDVINESNLSELRHKIISSISSSNIRTQDIDNCCSLKVNTDYQEINNISESTINCNKTEISLCNSINQQDIYEFISPNVTTNKLYDNYMTYSGSLIHSETKSQSISPFIHQFLYKNVKKLKSMNHYLKSECQLFQNTFSLQQQQIVSDVQTYITNTTKTIKITANQSNSRDDNDNNGDENINNNGNGKDKELASASHSTNTITKEIAVLEKILDDMFKVLHKIFPTVSFSRDVIQYDQEGKDINVMSAASTHGPQFTTSSNDNMTEETNSGRYLPSIEPSSNNSNNSNQYEGQDGQMECHAYEYSSQLVQLLFEFQQQFHILKLHSSNNNYNDDNKDSNHIEKSVTSSCDDPMIDNVSHLEQPPPPPLPFKANQNNNNIYNNNNITQNLLCRKCQSQIYSTPTLTTTSNSNSNSNSNSDNDNEVVDVFPHTDSSSRDGGAEVEEGTSARFQSEEASSPSTPTAFFSLFWMEYRPRHPPPPYGLTSPVIENLLSNWSTDPVKVKYLINWIESLVNQPLPDRFPLGLQLVRLSNIVKDGILMLLLPIMRNISAHPLIAYTRRCKDNTTSNNPMVNAKVGLSVNNITNESSSSRDEAKSVEPLYDIRVKVIPVTTITSSIRNTAIINTHSDSSGDRKDSHIEAEIPSAAAAAPPNKLTDKTPEIEKEVISVSDSASTLTSSIAVPSAVDARRQLETSPPEESSTTAAAAAAATTPKKSLSIGFGIGAGVGLVLNAVAAVSPLWKPAPASPATTTPTSTPAATATASGNVPQPPGGGALPASASNTATAAETLVCAPMIDTTQSYDFFFGNNDDYNSNLVSSRTPSSMPSNSTNPSNNQQAVLASSPVVNTSGHNNSVSIYSSDVLMAPKVDTNRKQHKETINPADRIAARLEALRHKKS